MLATSIRNQRIELEWNDNFSVGVEELDGQHQRLIQLINKIRKLNDLGNSSNNMMFSALNELIRYAEKHFMTEERYFQTYAYPQFNEHKKEHDDFVDKIYVMTQDLEKEILTFGGLLMHLTDWFTDHVKNTDQLYKEFLMEKLKGDAQQIIRIDSDGSDSSQ